MAFCVHGYLPEILPRLKPAQKICFQNQAALAALLCYPQKQLFPPWFVPTAGLIGGAFLDTAHPSNFTDSGKKQLAKLNKLRKEAGNAPVSA